MTLEHIKTRNEINKENIHPQTHPDVTAILEETSGDDLIAIKTNNGKIIGAQHITNKQEFEQLSQQGVDDQTQPNKNLDNPVTKKLQTAEHTTINIEETLQNDNVPRQPTTIEIEQYQDRTDINIHWTYNKQ